MYEIARRSTIPSDNVEHKVSRQKKIWSFIFDKYTDQRECSHLYLISTQTKENGHLCLIREWSFMFDKYTDHRECGHLCLISMQTKENVAVYT